MSLNWFANYGKVKATGLVGALMNQLVAADLDGASEADLLTYEQNLDKLVLAASEQAAVAKKERMESDEIVKLYNQKLAAIEILQTDAAATTDASYVAELNEVIEVEVSALEAMQADVEREEQEAVEAEADLVELKAIATEAAKALKTARTSLESAKKNLERNNRAVEREEAKLKRQQELKGLTSNVGKLSTALDIMNKQAEEAKVKAASLKMKGELIGVGDEKKSDIMQAAMAKAAGGTPPASSSIADRLSALKKK